MDKKKKIRTIVTAVIIIAMMVAGIVIAMKTLRGGGFGGLGGGGSFTLANAKKIQIGNTKSDVKSCVGNPDEDNEAEYIYYGSAYKKIIAQQEEIAEKMESVTDGKELENLLNKELELEKKLLETKYEYMLVSFDNENKVLSVIYDKEMSELSLNTSKTLKSTPNLSTSTALLYTAAGNVKVSAAAEYTDGSYKLAYVPTSAFAQLDATKTEAQRLVWEDDWCEYTAPFTYANSMTFTVTGYESKKFKITLALADGHAPENYLIEMTLSGSSEWRGRLTENEDFVPYVGYLNIMSKLTVEKGVTGINGICGGYNGFEALETVVLNEGLKYIEYYAFGDYVKNINIPASVTKLGQTALAGGDFTEINYGGTMAQWNAINKNDDWNYACKDFVVHCTDGDIDVPRNYH